MADFTAQRDKHIDDELWLVEHDPVFTLGRAGNAEDILAAGDIPVIRTDRGGQVTYHGPGQLVAYPLIDLRRLKIGVKHLVDRIEQSLIDRLAFHKVSASRREKAPGVYVEERKIAAIGLRVTRGCTFHGLAFNLDMETSPFQRINPCGFAGLEVTQLANFVQSVDFESEAWALAKTIAQHLNLDFSGI